MKLFRPDPDTIPQELRSLKQWVRWGYVSKPNQSRPAKIPFLVARDAYASSDDPRTWGEFSQALANVGKHGTCGVGIVLNGSCLIGIDLDHVMRDGALLPGIALILEDLHSYSEVSPSGEGVRVIARGTLPAGVKHRADLGDGAVLEFWDAGRYVTVTGDMLPGSIESIEDATDAICRLIDRYDLATYAEPSGDAPPTDIPLDTRLSRAARYLTKVPGAVSGEGGHTATFLTAQRIVRGFQLSPAEALPVLEEWNRKCSPPWDGADLARKATQAAAAGRMAWGCMLGKPTAAVVVQSAHDWKDDLIYRQLSDGGQVLERCLQNASVFLRHSDAWLGKLSLDTFSGETNVTGAPIDAPDGRWTDLHTNQTTAWLQLNLRLMVATDLVDQAVQIAAAANPKHPVKDYLNTLEWDGVERLDSWLEDLAGVPGTQIARAQARRFLVGAVARVARPGCKLDSALILEGPQNLGKSTLLSILFSPWYSDDIDVLGSKDSAMQLRGVWGLEIAELSSLHRAEVERVKSFITRREDRFRPPYGRRVEAWPRQLVFVGSTNRSEYLIDETGGRRFWGVKCAEIDLKGAESVKDQLWAEAVVAFGAGESWWLDSDELQVQASQEQEKRYQADAWEDDISDALEPFVWQMRGDVTISKVFDAIKVDVARRDRSSQMRVAAILKRFGYECKVLRRDGRSTRVYVRTSEAT